MQNRLQFFVGSVVLTISAFECVEAVMVERVKQSSQTARGAVDVRQLVVATDDNLDALLRNEKVEPSFRASVFELVKELAGFRPPALPAVLGSAASVVDAISAIERAPDEATVALHLLSAARALGGSNALYMLNGRGKDGNLVSHRILTTGPQDTLAITNYIDETWFATDPFLTHAGRSHSPCYSSDLGLLENLTGSRLEMGKFVRSIGLSSFAVHPAHAPRSDKFGALYVTSPVIPGEQGEEPLRRNEVLLRALSFAVLNWYLGQERYAALRQSGLNTAELQILDVIAKGGTAEMARERAGVSKAAMRAKITPSIRSKLSAKNLIRAAKVAEERGLLAAASDRKVAYVVYSPRWGVFLREDFGIPFWSGLNPQGLDTAQLFPDAASARRVFDAQPAGHDCELRRVEVHFSARNASIVDCVAAGLPAWNPSTVHDNSPADDSATWGSRPFASAQVN